MEVTHYRITPLTKAWLQHVEVNEGLEAMEREFSRFMQLHDTFSVAIGKMLSYGHLGTMLLWETIGGLIKNTLEAQFTEEERKERIKCQKGCGECCKMYTSILQCEAKYILRRAKLEDVAIDWERLERQVGKKEKDFYTMGDDKKCVFLSESGSCKIYDYRPCACRVYMVADKGTPCTMEYEELVQQIFMVSPEAFLTAAFDLEGYDTENMAETLLKFRGIYEDK